MIRVEKIELSQLRFYVELSYEGDQQGLDHYHDAPYTLQQAVNRTMHTIYTESEEVHFSYYRVMKGSVAIGYMVTAPSVLYSFAIQVKHRKPRVLLDWWQEVDRLLQKPYMAILYAKNKRAINFLQKRGMGIIGIDPESTAVTLLNI